MKLVESVGPFHYKITGADSESETAAAEALERAIDLLSHTSQDFDADLRDSQDSIAKRYNVSISIHEA